MTRQAICEWASRMLVEYDLTGYMRVESIADPEATALG